MYAIRSYYAPASTAAVTPATSPPTTTMYLPEQIRQAVEGSLARAGLASALVQMGTVGEALELRLGDAPFDAILDWLAAVQRELRVRPVRVEVAREAGA